MDPQISQKLQEQDQKLDAIYVSVEKMRKYFLWSLIITVGAIVLPLIGLAFVIPQFISSYTSTLTLPN